MRSYDNYDAYTRRGNVLVMYPGGAHLSNRLFYGSPENPTEREKITEVERKKSPISPFFLIHFIRSFVPIVILLSWLCTSGIENRALTEELTEPKTSPPPLLG